MLRLGVASLLAVGCRPEPVVGPTIRFDLSRAGGLFDAPFPSDDLLVGGVVDLSSFPNPDGVVFVEQVRALGDGVLDGWSTSSAIVFSATEPLDPASLPTLSGAFTADASVFLVDVDPASPERGRRVPVVVTAPAATPFGPDYPLVVLPLQGAPLRPTTRYAAIVTDAVRAASGTSLAPGEAMRALASGDPQGVDEGVAGALSSALVSVESWGTPRGSVVALAVFTTQDPVAQAVRFTEAARAYTPLAGGFSLTDTFDDYCVFEGTMDVPVFQRGDPPFLAEGGGWSEGASGPELQGFETSRVVVTVPRGPQPSGGYPTVVFVRTGGGGDRPLVDRGVRDADGVVSIPGSGPAMALASVGIAGVSIDGPHGGMRNDGGGDEQFLMFNVANPEALLDNVRQSALELALLPDVIDNLTLDASACGLGSVSLSTDRLGLMGHSMGATIAPLTLALEPRYAAAVLSGAGGSYIENVVWKQLPLEVAPIAEVMLGYDAGTLAEDDPVLSLLQHVGELADPPPYLRALGERASPPHMLVFQGIVDHYILPPMANALSASAGLDVGGEVLDASTNELSGFLGVEGALELVGRGPVALPVSGNGAGGQTAVVVQLPADGVEDGHEVMFQRLEAPPMYACFFADVAAGAVPSVVPPGVDCRAN